MFGNPVRTQEARAIRDLATALNPIALVGHGPIGMRTCLGVFFCSFLGSNKLTLGLVDLFVPFLPPRMSISTKIILW